MFILTERFFRNSKCTFKRVNSINRLKECKKEIETIADELESNLAIWSKEKEDVNHMSVLKEKLELIDYSDLKDDQETLNFESDNGWVGITDKYWIASLIPEREKKFRSDFEYKNKFRASFIETKATEIRANENKSSQCSLFV